MPGMGPPLGVEQHAAEIVGSTVRQAERHLFEYLRRYGLAIEVKDSDNTAHGLQLHPTLLVSELL